MCSSSKEEEYVNSMVYLEKIKYVLILQIEEKHIV
jgi:hypothetical protein